jgi:hypothetical protein
MSSPIWTAAALSSELRRYRGEAWRLVEAQHRVATMPLVDDLGEQEILERLIEETKPPVPAPCRHLHWLLAAPFRYRPHPHPSRFRPVGGRDGVFYGAEEEATAVAEIAFWRLLFFAEAPEVPWPDRALEFTAFAASLATGSALDLTLPPLDRDRALWTHPTDYAACHALAAEARVAGAELLRYESVRDPRGGAALAVLVCTAFAAPGPVADSLHTWQLFLDAHGVRAVREFPPHRVAFAHADFAGDPRIAGMRRERP